MVEPDRPDHRALIAELQSPRFEVGVRQGHWRIISFEWPFLVVGVRTRDGAELAFRCSCIGYPAQRPEIGLWNAERGCSLSPAERPTMTGRYSLIFRTDWESGLHIYHPMDRLAFVTHGNWLVDLRFKLWIPDRGFTQLCQELHNILTSNEYQPGRKRAA